MRNDHGSADGAASKIDSAASDACVRSGIFILLVSAAICLLIPSWKQLPNDEAVRIYVRDRLFLKDFVDSIELDPKWEHEDSKSISEIFASNIMSEPDGRNKVNRLVSALEGLNQSDTLMRSRKVSAYFRFSIKGWVDRRRNLLRRRCPLKHFAASKHENKDDDDFVDSLDDEAMLDCLTFAGVRDLADFEPPVLNPPDIPQTLSPSVDVSISPSLPHNLFQASLIAEFFLLFALAYFLAHLRAAIQSPAFPVQGTIFGAFAHWSVGWVLASVAICPAGMSLWLVAYVYYSPASFEHRFHICAAGLVAAALSVFICGVLGCAFCRARAPFGSSGC